MTTSPVTSLEIIRPDDWHLHFRDGDFLKTTVNATARVFKRAIVMPNLKPPITTTKQALEYRGRIQAAAKPAYQFEPLMTLYLQDQMDLKDIEEGFEKNIFAAAKLYPAHATTNSAHGVTDIKNIAPVLKLLTKYHKPLLIHGEVTLPTVDAFDREKRFITDTLEKLCVDFPHLKIVFEHITTKEAVKFVRMHKGQVGATITPQHLKFNRNAMFEGGLRPHYYCLPMLKREEDRLSLLDAATSGENSFFLGTDSAPHTIATKETACGCAGIFNATHAIEVYTEIFEQQGKLDRLEKFASVFGAEFYGLPINTQKIMLKKIPRKVPSEITFESSFESNTEINAKISQVKPFLAGDTISWTCV